MALSPLLQNVSGSFRLSVCLSVCLPIFVLLSFAFHTQRGSLSRGVALDNRRRERERKKERVFFCLECQTEQNLRSFSPLEILHSTVILVSYSGIVVATPERGCGGFGILHPILTLLVLKDDLQAVVRNRSRRM